MMIATMLVAGASATNVGAFPINYQGSDVLLALTCEILGQPYWASKYVGGGSGNGQGAMAIGGATSSIATQQTAPMSPMLDSKRQRLLVQRRYGRFSGHPRVRDQAVLRVALQSSGSTRWSSSRARCRVLRTSRSATSVPTGGRPATAPFRSPAATQSRTGSETLPSSMAAKTYRPEALRPAINRQTSPTTLRMDQDSRPNSGENRPLRSRHAGRPWRRP